MVVRPSIRGVTLDETPKILHDGCPCKSHTLPVTQTILRFKGSMAKVTHRYKYSEKNV